MMIASRFVVPDCSTNLRQGFGLGRPIHATRIPVPVRISQTWLRRFNSAFVSHFFGSQALQRCSGLLNRRARSVTVATHHFAGVAQQRQVFAHGGSFVNCLRTPITGVRPARVQVAACKRSLRRLHFRSRSSKYQSATLRTSRLQVRVLPGAPISRACGSTRIAEGPDSESGSLGGAIPFMPTISRRLASAGTADPGDLKSPSLPGASPGSPTGVWFTGNSRPIRLKIE